MPPPNENITSLTERHNPYPGIDISKYAGKYKGKVLFLTGASRGLGAHTAKAFAKTGAHLFISARNGALLQSLKNEIEREHPGVEVAYAVTDVSKKEDVKAAVDLAVAKFGRIDFVVSNAGVNANWDTKLAEEDPDIWWSVLDINFKGSYLVARTIPYLIKTKGYIIFLSSFLAQSRTPTASNYNISKHAINRFAEYVVEEYGDKGIKSFAVNPGAVRTDMSEPYPDKSVMIDSPDLVAYMQARLVSGTEDWLSGRYVSSNWDLDELGECKKEILESDALKNRLVLPPSLV